MFRTPTQKTQQTVDPVDSDTHKLPDMAERAGPSLESSETSNVRRSIGEWETGKLDAKAKASTSPKKVAPALAGPSEPKSMAVLSQESRTTRETSVDAAGKPPEQEKPKYADRVAEARACLNRAKTQLGSARNLRTDIKTDVNLAVERLYQLVKEAEMGKGKEEKNQKKGQEGGKEQEQQVLSPSIPLASKTDSDLIKKLEEHSKLLRENNGRMEALKEAMERQKEVLEKTTYAGVVAGQTRRKLPEHTALHSVVVSSKDETETGEEVLGRIREAVNAKDGWIKVDRVRKAKDRKVIVGCRTEEEKMKVKERLAKAETHLNVEEVKNKDPLLILIGVLQYNSDEDVLNALRNQNRSVFDGLDKEDYRVEIRYRKKTRNPHTCHIVLRVSTKVWNRMLDAQDIQIDLQKIRVADQSPLVQCSMCLGYGHGRRFCKETVEICSHCGGPHMRTECADWLAGIAPTCSNCKHARHAVVEHSAFSQECPVRRKWDALARATIAYC